MNTKLSDNVGNTPLIPITIGEYTVWGKAEFMNPSGSVKDRMATYIINNAEKLKLIKRGSTLCEATSGNSGISFAMLAAERGYNMVIIMPSNMSEERKNIIGNISSNYTVINSDFHCKPIFENRLHAKSANSR